VETKDLDNILNGLDSYLGDSPSMSAQELESIVQGHIKKQKSEKIRAVINFALLALVIVLTVFVKKDLFGIVMHTVLIFSIAYFYYLHLRARRNITLQDKTVSLEEFTKHKKELNISIVNDFKLLRKVFYPQVILHIVVSIILINQHYDHMWSLLDLLIKVLASIFVYRTIESTIKKYNKLAES
jgi:hypothetical protein